MSPIQTGTWSQTICQTNPRSWFLGSFLLHLSSNLGNCHLRIQILMWCSPWTINHQIWWPANNLNLKCKCNLFGYTLVDHRADSVVTWVRLDGLISWYGGHLAWIYWSFIYLCSPDSSNLVRVGTIGSVMNTTQFLLFFARVGISIIRLHVANK